MGFVRLAIPSIALLMFLAVVWIGDLKVLPGRSMNQAFDHICAHNLAYDLASLASGQAIVHIVLRLLFILLTLCSPIKRLTLGLCCFNGEVFLDKT